MPAVRKGCMRARSTNEQDNAIHATTASKTHQQSSRPHHHDVRQRATSLCIHTAVHRAPEARCGAAAGRRTPPAATPTRPPPWYAAEHQEPVLPPDPAPGGVGPAGYHRPRPPSSAQEAEHAATRRLRSREADLTPRGPDLPTSAGQLAVAPRRQPVVATHQARSSAMGRRVKARPGHEAERDGPDAHIGRPAPRRLASPAGRRVEASSTAQASAA